MAKHYEITLKMQSEMPDHDFLEMIGELMLYCEERNNHVIGWGVKELQV